MRTVTKGVALAALSPLLLIACSKSSSSTASTTGTSSPATAGSSAASSAPAAGSGPLASLSADQIAAKANADLKAATSYRVRGTLTAGGSAEKVDFTRAPGKCKGSITLSGSSTGFVLIGSEFWLSAGGSGYLRADSQAASFKKSLDLYCAPGQLVALIVPLAELLSKGHVTTVDGQQVLQLTLSGDVAVDVTDTATPEYVRVYQTKANQYDFSDINAPVTIAPPA